MKTKLWTTVFVVGLLILLTHFVWVTPALADDVTPPSVPTEEVVVETLPPTEEPVAEVLPIEPVATEEPVVVEPIATEPPTTEEPVPVDLLQDLPADTSLVVLGENGEVLPLATQEAAEVIAIADPIWCPVNVSPTPGANGCTSSFASLSDLVAGFVPTGNGTIWIESGNQGGSAAIINGTTYNFPGMIGNWSAAKSYDLTLQGGWSGVSGDSTIGENSVFNVPIVVVWWSGDLTINNITVTGVTNPVLYPTTIDWVNRETETIGVYGLQLTRVKKTSINKSNFNNNTNGAWIMGWENPIEPRTEQMPLYISNSTFNNNSYAGLFGGHFSDMYIVNSEFNGNHNKGAHIQDSNGVVEISNSHFDNNSLEMGFWLKNWDSYYPNGKSVTITDSTFNNNVAGMHVQTSGIFTLNSVSASGNNKGDNVSGNSGVAAYGYGSIFVNGGNYSNNSHCGLYIESTVSIMLNGVTATDNEACGYYALAPSLSIVEAEVQSSPVGILEFLGTSTGSQIEFELSCADRSNYYATLPNEDKIQIVCPVSGKAIIKRLNNTAIPGELPAGYTYASAFSLDILQSGKSISYISEGGRVNVSFDVPNLEEGTVYTLLYWDNGSWLPLKDFMLDENGNPREFNLHPNDPRMILSGLKLVFEDGTPRLELSTNFPGIFVLVQR